MTASVTEEFRVLYRISGFATTNYHYYMAQDAEQALRFQNQMMKSKDQQLELLSVERFDRFADKWIDESYVLSDE